ncbi:MAG TPA: DUF3570 domain-containing protein [Fimbriimonadaceae bacterium]|nr:DUF3570 domain-containing protein [Fimbriimonadaceae bacterium]
MWVSVLLFVQLQRQARAEDALSYKFESYQEARDRIKVIAHYARAEKQLSDGTTLSIQGVVDTITGATPSGEPAPEGSDQVPLSTVKTEVRRGLVLNAGHAFGQHELSGQLSYSGESDYTSRAFSFTDLVNFNQKNTVLQIGYARSNDVVHPVFFADELLKKSDDFIVGVTQILDPRTTVTVDLGWGRSRGYLSDPYKIIEKDTELFPGLFLPLTFPENRPDQRSKATLYVSCTHFFDKANGSAEASFRYFDDNWGIQSGTLELAWFQKLGERFVLSPSVRIYQQSAADFYMLSLNGTSIEPGTVATGAAPFYSSDYRLAKFRAVTLGIKLVAKVSDHLSLDASYEDYDMRGRDGFTPQSAFCRADVVNLGAHWNF